MIAAAWWAAGFLCCFAAPAFFVSRRIQLAVITNVAFCGASRVSLRKVIFDHSYVDVVMGSASTMRTVFLSRESSFACLLGVVETSVYNVGRFFCLSRTESRCQQCVPSVETSVLQLHEFRISEDTSHVLVLVLGDIGRSPRMQMRTQTIQPNPS